jgi:cytochrome P450
MRRDYLGFVTQLHRDHGDISCMRLGPERAWDLMSPEVVREALVAQADGLIRWERGISVFEQVFGQSVLVTEGPTWQRQRRMLMAAFTPKRVAGYAALMTEAAQTHFDRLLSPGQDRALVEMDALWGDVAMQVILRTLFGPRVQADTRAAVRATQVLSATAFREMFHLFTLPDHWPLPGKADKRWALATLRQLVQSHIDAAALQTAPSGHPSRQTGSDAVGLGPQGLLGELHALRDAETGEALSAQEVFDQCMVSFQAGHETTATALLWWSRLMAEHPQAAQRAREEVRAVVGDASAHPTAEQAARLPWLNATLKEALRLYPPAAALISRRTTRDLRLGGWLVPRGAMLRITPWVLHRDPALFPEPEAFRPERFMDGAPPLPRGAWMPYGVGPRVCLGQHFAQLEMALLAAMLLQRFKLSLPPDAAACQPALNLTLRPKDPIRLWVDRLA